MRWIRRGDGWLRVPLTLREGRASARLNVFNPFGQTMLYELVRK